MAFLRRHWRLLAFFVSAGLVISALEYWQVRSSSIRMIEEMIAVLSLGFLLLQNYEPPRVLTNPFPPSLARVMSAVTVTLVAVILMLLLAGLAFLIREALA